MKVAGGTFQKIPGMFSWSITFKEPVSDLIFSDSKAWAAHFSQVLPVTAENMQRPAQALPKP